LLDRGPYERKAEATIEDLYHMPEHGKAEIVNGEVLLMSPTGKRRSRAAFKISIRLYEYEQCTGSGIAVADTAIAVGQISL
jgi:hypothetical protein